MEQEILEFLNSKIREEHGNRITMENLWMDAEVDSFGTTMVFLDMDEKYGGFNNVWFRSVDNWQSTVDENGTVLKQGITIKEIVERALDESTKPQIHSSEQ